MEANGGGGSGSGSAAPAWDLAMHWAPAGDGGSSSYPQQQALALRPAGPGGGVHSQLHLHLQQQQQELTCLKLGKRPACCWAGGPPGNNQVAAAPQAGGGGGAAAGLPQVLHGCSGSSGTTTAEGGKRKEKLTAAVPRCQVEGCHVALGDAKDYHRRHKVCQAHSKAPRVVVLGSEQRFCQQCSRFHAISEFDDAKRSCRRRLAGHNERRRKTNASEAMARGALAHAHGMTAFGHGFLPAGSPAAAGALSLLSSARVGGGGAPRSAPWQLATTPEISARSSAALEDLIAENRAALLAWQYFSADHHHHHHRSPPADQPASSGGSGWPPHPHPHGGGGGGYHHVAVAPPPAAWHASLGLMPQTAAVPPAATGGEPPLRPVPERAGARPRGGYGKTTTKDKDGDAAGCSSLDAWAAAGGARVL